MPVFRGQDGALYLDVNFYSELCTYANGTKPFEMNGPARGSLSWDDGQNGDGLLEIGSINNNAFRSDRVVPPFVGGIGDIALGDARYSLRIKRGASATTGNEEEQLGFGGRYFGGININGVHSGVWCSMKSTSSTQVSLIAQATSAFSGQGVIQVNGISWPQGATKYLGFDVVNNNVELWHSDAGDSGEWFFKDRTIHGDFDLGILLDPGVGEGGLLLTTKEALNESVSPIVDDLRVGEVPVAMLEVTTWNMAAELQQIDDTVKGDTHRSYKGGLGVWEGSAGAWLDYTDSKQAAIIDAIASQTPNGSLGEIILQSDDDKMFRGDVVVDNFNVQSQPDSTVVGVGFSFRGTGQVVPDWT